MTDIKTQKFTEPGPLTGNDIEVWVSQNAERIIIQSEWPEESVCMWHADAVALYDWLGRALGRMK